MYYPGAGKWKWIKDPYVEERTLWFSLLSQRCLGPTSDKSSSCKPNVLERKGRAKVAKHGKPYQSIIGILTKWRSCVLKEKTIRKLILYQSQTVLTAPQPTFHLIGATALLWSWSGTRNWQEPWRRRTRLLEGLMTRIHVLKHHAVLRKMPCLGKMSIPRM